MEPSIGAPRISAIVPVYDERESLPALLEELMGALHATGQSFEIVLVDDGSADGSDTVIADAARRFPCVTGVLLDRNEGQSSALAAGFRHARGDLLVTLDADGQNDPADIPRLLAMLEDADVVSGVRGRRADRWRRRVSSRIANAVRRAVLRDTITDIGCSLKAYRRAALEGLPFFVGAHRFLPALCELRGSRVVEIRVRHRERRHGQSKYGVGNRLFRGIYDLLGARWLRSRLVRSRTREVIHA